MIVYFDSSVLMPILLSAHINNAIARELLAHELSSGNTAITCQHTYGELYRHITRNVAPFELLPAEAYRGLFEGLSSVISFEVSGVNIYKKAIQRCVALNLRGAIIYDAVHLETAIDLGASLFYTDNTKDFTRLLTDADPLKIQSIR